MFRKIYSCIVLSAGMLGAAWVIGCYCGWSFHDQTEKEAQIEYEAEPIEKEVSEEEES